MANYNKTLTITSSTASITQNVNVNDTITVTVNSAGNNTGAATVTNNSSSVCSISSTSVNIGSSFVITANATGTISVVVILIYNKEGDSEGGTVGGTVSTPSPTYSVTAPASINEGSPGTINVSTTNVSNTTLYWTVTPADDFVTSSGSFSLTSNSGSFTVTPESDNTTEGAETATIQIRTGSTSGTSVATDTFTINDTSTTPATYSISGSPTTVAGGNNVTFSWSSNQSATYYYNSADFGSGTLGTGTSGTKALTASNSFSGDSSSSSVTMRTANTTGAIKATSNSITIYKSPSTPTVAASSISTSGFIATATAGSTDAGTLQVSINNSTWFTSPKSFTGLSENTSYTIYARQVNNIAISGTATTTATTDQSIIAPDLTVSPSPASLILSSTNPQGSVTIGGVASYEEVAVRVNNGTTNLATATGNNQTLTWTSSLPAQGATVTYEVFIRVPTASGGNNVWYETNDTFTRTRAVLDINIAISNYSGGPIRYGNNNATFAGNSTAVIINTPPQYTHQLTGCGSDTVYYASLTSGASAGSTTAYSNLSPIGRTFHTTSTRSLMGMSGVDSFITGPSDGTGHVVYIWALAKGDSSVVSSSVMTYTGQSYIAERPDKTIVLAPSTTSLSNTDTTSPTVAVTGDTTGTQYRLYTDNISRWVNTIDGNGTSSSSFTISYAENPDGTANPSGTFTELPGNGQDFVYYTQARVTGGTPDEQAGTPTGTYWINTGNSFTIARTASRTYSVSASPTSINEGQSTTFTVTTTNVDDDDTVGYTLSGISAEDLTTGGLTGTLTISSNTASVSITLANDGVTEQAETVTLTLASTDSTESSTGTPSASVSIADTSTAGSGGGTTLDPGTANAYGLEVLNPSGNVILSDISRSGTFLGFDSHTFTSGGAATDTMFTGFNCSSKSTTGIFITNWTGNARMAPNITRSSNGITVTRSPINSTGVYGTVSIDLVRY